MTDKELKPGEKAAILQEWELEARLTDVAIDEGMASKGEEGPNKVAATSLLPEVKKAQNDSAPADPGRRRADALYAVTRRKREGPPPSIAQRTAATPVDGNAASTWPPRVKQMPRFVQLIGTDRGPQQREPIRSCCARLPPMLRFPRRGGRDIDRGG